MNRPRDGVVQRGSTWSYVIRVADLDSGRSRPVGVGGFATEREVKAARDVARVSARRGEYVDRSAVTVGEYLAEWLDVHEAALKATTSSGYRTLTRLYVVPRIGAVKLQAVRPAMITTLYRDLIREGGRDGRPLSPRSIAHVHKMLNKAFADAVNVEQLLSANPVDRATRPRGRRDEPKQVWTPAQLAPSSTPRRDTACSRSTGWPLSPGLDVVSC